jgi:hypothetical protein
MTNEAFHRLWNEWSANKYNEDFLEICKAHKIDPLADYIDTVDMIGVRKVCKVKGVWLKDFDEQWIYSELMPLGGYNGKLTKVKAALKELRQARKNNEPMIGFVDYLCEKYA